MECATVPAGTESPAGARQRRPTSCVVRLAGGLGNQLFQYAAGRALALRLECDLILDTSFFDRRGRHRQFELGRFPAAAFESRALAPWWRRLLPRRHFRRNAPPVFRETHFHFAPAFEAIDAPVCLEGYFQSEKYFARFAPQLRLELLPPPPASPAGKRLAEEIAGARATILHVRRGDYVAGSKAASLYAHCELDYYARALRAIGDPGPVFVFSDDILWARENLCELGPLQFVGDGSPRDAVEDLKLMSLGFHHVIANSTFSWWGAWLAGPSKGRTIAPKSWFRDSRIDDSDLLPPTWERL